MEVTRDANAGSGSGRWSVLWLVGMFLVFLGERMVGSGTSRTIATSAGLVLVLGAMVMRFVRAGKLSADQLAAASAAATSFKPQSVDRAANDITPPPGGWDVAAAPVGGSPKLSSM